MDHKYADHESPHASFPIIAVAIIGIFTTIFVLVFYYIFVIKCCLNWHRIDILRRFSLSRSRSTNHNYHQHHSTSTSSELPKGLDESVIRLIPIFKFQKKQNDSEHECAVCLAEFQDNEKLRMIPNCVHVFHIDCIDVWLQNNPNCPLCRNSISISIPSHYPLPEDTTIDISPPYLSEDNDYVVIELCNNLGERRNVTREDDATLLLSPTKVPKKTGKNVRKNYGNVLSMGDECIDVNTRRKGDDQFDIQPIRRSFSMDSASDRQLLLAVQEIVQRNTMNDHVDISEVNDDGSSSNRLRRGFFSFGHARSAILPLHLNSQD